MKWEVLAAFIAWHCVGLAPITAARFSAFLGTVNSVGVKAEATHGVNFNPP